MSRNCNDYFFTRLLYLNMSLLGLEKLFGLVLVLGIPEIAERMNWTKFYRGWVFWRRHYMLGFNGVRFEGNNTILGIFLLFLVMAGAYMAIAIGN